MFCSLKKLMRKMLDKNWLECLYLSWSDPKLCYTQIILNVFRNISKLNFDWGPFEKSQHSLLQYCPFNHLKITFLVCLCMCVWNVNVECECICACGEVMVNYGSQVSPSNTWILQAPLLAKPRWLGLLC